MTQALVVQKREMEGLADALEQGEFGMAQSLVNAMIQLCPSVDRAVAVAGSELVTELARTNSVLASMLECMEQHLTDDEKEHINAILELGDKVLAKARGLND